MGYSPLKTFCIQLVALLWAWERYSWTCRGTSSELFDQGQGLNLTLANYFWRRSVVNASCFFATSLGLQSLWG